MKKMQLFKLQYTDNTCKRCSGPLPGGGYLAWAVNQDQANVGQTFCEDCKNAMEAPEQPEPEVPKAPEKITPIDSLPLDANIIAALIAGGFTTVEQVRKADEADLVAVKGIGKSTAEKIRAAVEV